jgi:spore coat polysaccharide biosynthesis predicted glycosyltransferase SpsG
MNARVAIRANGGANIGFGHINRCLALASALVAQGADAVLVVNPESRPDQWRPAAGVSVATVPVAETTDLHETSGLIARLGIHALVVDSYDVGPLAFSRIQIPVAAVVDAPPLSPVSVALLVNGSANAAEHDHKISGRGKLLLGPAFVMLAPPFSTPTQRAQPKPVTRVLVTIGGSDDNGFSTSLLRSALSGVPEATVTVVAGPYFPAAVVDELTRLSTEQPRIDLVRSPATLKPLMDAADMAVTSGGQTTYELAATGTPACAVRLAANQTGNLEGLSARNALLWVGDADERDIEQKMTEAVSALAQDQNRRLAMSRAGQAIVDGQGAHRVASAILGLCA